MTALAAFIDPVLNWPWRPDESSDKPPQHALEEVVGSEAYGECAEAVGW